jgi:hypothetical protein
MIDVLMRAISNNGIDDVQDWQKLAEPHHPRIYQRNADQEDGTEG